MYHPMALREWAVAVKALEAGRQIIVLRKGGIAEETKEFRLESPRFYLFPSYEHQKPHLVKPEAADTVTATLAEAAENPETIRITSYAEAIDDIEVTDSETLKRLDALHIWTEDYAEERLKWKKTKPLHVLLLRVYTLGTPAEIPLRDSYGGCKSWLQLEEALGEGSLHPALTDEAFEAQAEAVRRAVAG
ncbi:DUF1802 family protein [Cohnella nanjingensis]|uniref:DUF1802 family protein n=1 Tax=Cohnella nanjingensis TaxID=1387779 RepID=A0A7X0VG08_9BACL|nr:DUF1802 family protein [Cohnella nanjingensis]MBB6672356.1 DUF1802 family protein [Cohnella nanjingensis]